MFFLLAGLACQLPAQLVESLRPTETTRLATSTITPVLAFSPTSLHPPVSTLTPGAAYPEPLTETAYPAPPQTEFPGLLASPTGTSAATVQSTLQGTSETVTPTSSTGNAQEQGAPTSTLLGTATTSAENPYPGAGFLPTPMDNLYPQSGGFTPTTPASYPGLVTPFPFMTPTPTSTGSAALTSSPGATASKRPGGTPSATSGFTAQPTPTTVFFTPSFTPTTVFYTPSFTPTRTRFLTPTPSLTPTPTMTRTPLPFPPWVSTKLRASNPLGVRLAAGKPQLVEFFAFWSGPSLAMAPLVQGLEREYSGRVNFVYLDIDDPANDSFKQQLRFRIVPHFFLLDARGRVLNQWMGYVSVSELRRALDSALR